MDQPKLYDLDALRPLSLFSPSVPVQAVTLDVDERLDRWGHGYGRTAEVIFVVRRAPDELLLVNKAGYPADTYRLPTGGVQEGEAPRQAAIREIYEETGYEVRDAGLLGVVDYELHHPDQGEGPFVSYVFVADVEQDQTPHATLEGEIDGYRWQPVSALGQTAGALRQLPEDWTSWGRFRAVSYEFIQCGIMQYNQRLMPASGSQGKER
jgi:8-oxo-dGTP pyrophosphatase MutT (NUDIX family)